MASECAVCGQPVTAVDCHYNGKGQYYHGACFYARDNAAARAALAEEALQACKEHGGADQRTIYERQEVCADLILKAEDIAARLAALEATCNS